MILEDLSEDMTPALEERALAGGICGGRVQGSPLSRSSDRDTEVPTT